MSSPHEGCVPPDLPSPSPPVPTRWSPWLGCGRSSSCPAKEKFQSFFETSRDGIALVDLEGRIVEANRAFVDLVGYTRSELQRLTFPGITPERWHLAEDAVIREQVLVRGYCDPYEKEYLRKDGTLVPVSLLVWLLKDLEGHPLGFWGIIRDITEAKRLETELQTHRERLEDLVAERLADLQAEILERRRVETLLRESEARVLRQHQELEGIYRQAPIGLCILDRELRFQRVNERLADIDGFAAEAHLGCRFQDVLPDLAEILVPVFREVLDTGTPVTGMEVRGITPRQPGVEREWRGSFYPVAGEDGRVSAMTCVVEEVTERRRIQSELEQLREALYRVSRVSTLGELAASMAHELNQPLTAIQANARAALRLIQDGRASMEDLQEILEDIASDDLRAGEIIRRMREPVKREALVPGRLLPNELVQEIHRLLRNDTLRTRIHLVLDLEEGLPTVYGDRIHLQQVLLNLVMNAQEALLSVATASRRSIVLRTRSARDRRVAIEVLDNGPGIPESLFETLFDPFITTKPHGLGLGLSICRTLVEAHGDTLSASNEPTGGARIAVLLPSEADSPLQRPA